MVRGEDDRVVKVNVNVKGDVIEIEAEIRHDWACMFCKRLPLVNGANLLRVSL